MIHKVDLKNIVYLDVLKIYIFNLINNKNDKNNKINGTNSN